MSENSKYEIYDYNFKKITDETFDTVRESNDYLIINKNNNWNVMDTHGNIMLNKNYSYIDKLKNYNGYLLFSVRDGNKYNVVNRLGQRLFDEDVNQIHLTYDGIVYHQNGDKRFMPYEEAIKRMR